MTPERYQQITQLFHSALELDPGKRERYLDQECSGDKELQREVLKLLAGRERAGDFLDSPAVVAAAEVLAEEAEPMVGKRLGRFEILSLLGVGGMGEVYLAQDEQLGRRVALKVLPVEFTAHADRLNRFKREARAASSLNHPNIITIHDIGEIEGHHFIATEFIEGETLRQRIARGRVELSQALEIAIQVANALEIAHLAGIVHRDIKPENLMLRPDGYVKILDFGLAKLGEAQRAKSSTEPGGATIAMGNETTPGMILGTVNYMSPEQARGLKVDGRSDLWSLAITLYEMLTCKTPFNRQTMTDTIVSIVEREPQPPSQLDRRLPAELDRIMAKALAKDGALRYQSAKEMAADLKSLQYGIGKATMAQEPVLNSGHTTILAPSFNSLSETLFDEKIDEKIVPVRKFNFRSLSIVIAVLLVIALGLGWSLIFRSRKVTPPETPAITTPTEYKTQISYRLSIQNMIGGKEAGSPYDSLGREVFESSDRFQLQFSSPQDGYLYLLDEDSAVDGIGSYSLLFPTPFRNNGSSQIRSNQPFETGRYLFDPNKRTDTLIFIWSASPIEELEAVKSVVNERELGRITNRNQLAAIRAFLNRHSQSTTEAVVDESSRQTTLKGQSDTIIHFLRLRHT